jgi:hypothetical protein
MLFLIFLMRRSTSMSLTSIVYRHKEVVVDVFIGSVFPCVEKLLSCKIIYLLLAAFQTNEGSIFYFWSNYLC